MLRFFLLFGCLFLDQLTKYLVFRLEEPIRILPFLSIVKVQNEGFVFGTFQHWDGFFKDLFYYGIPTLIVLGLVYYLFKTSDRWTGLALALIAGGGIGNMLDRLLLGKVRDFIDFHVGNWHYPAFNVADVCISAGIALLLFYHFGFFKKLKALRDNKT